MATVIRHGRRVKVKKKVKKSVATSLSMPSEFVAQNGVVIHQDTHIAVEACPRATKAKKKH